MNWLNKIVRGGHKKSDKPAAAAHAVAAANPPVADPQQLRLRLAQAQTAADKERLERELGAALAQVRQAPRRDDAALVRCCAVAQLADKACALSWLAEILDDDSLAELALHARFAEVRLAAALRLSDTKMLERVAQASRDKDKGVYRHCANALRQRQAASDCAVRLAALEQELERMLAADPVSATRLVELEKEFGSLNASASGRCAALFEQLRQRARDQARHLQQLNLRHQATQALAAELARQPQLSEALWQQSHEQWCALADNAATWPAWLAGHKELTALQHLHSQIEAHLAAAREDLDRVRECTAFLESRGQDAPLDEAAISAWEALTKPDQPQLLAELQSRWAACLSRSARQRAMHPASPPPPPPLVRPQRDKQLALKRIVLLEEAIEQGRLADAGKLEAEIDGDESGGLPHALAQRLQRARAQLLRLRGWARWGSEQARQQLIAKAEELAQENAGVDSLSQAIAKLRQEWKSLDAHGASSRPLWEQFDTAVEKAYAPVAAHRIELAARHAAARQAKEALCLEWESWLAQISWEHADIQAIQAMRQQIRETWRAAAAAAGREERLLRKRFDALLASLDARIEAARQQEISRCEMLIATAEGLLEHANLRQAIDSIKALQQRWRDEAIRVGLPRAQSEALWQRFRGACNAVFARRDDEKAQQTAQRAQRVEAAQRRLAELEAALADDDIVKVQQTLAEFRAAWREANAGALTAAAKETQQRAETRLHALQASKRQAPYQLMARKMALVEQIERAAAAGESMAAGLGEVQSAWQSLPRLPDRLEKPLARRFAAAPGTTSAILAEGRKLRESLLLDLEIALGLRSPDAQDQLRRARQLQLLQQRFRKDPAPQVDVDMLIANWHATAAVSDQEQQQRMAEILRTMADRPPSTGL